MTSDTRSRLIQWTKTGAWQGVKWGFLLANLYMIGTTLCFAGVSIWATSQAALTDGRTDALSAVLLATLFLPVVWFFGLFFGVLPAIIVGGVVGTVAGFVTAVPPVYESVVVRRVTGVGIVLLLVGLLGSLLATANVLPSTDFATEGTFWFYIGVPALFCLGFVFWLSGKLPALAARPSVVETIAAERPVPPPLWLE